MTTTCKISEDFDCKKQIGKPKDQSDDAFTDYCGKYVATRSFLSKKVEASGANAEKVYNKAIKNGIKNPVVFFVPEKDMVHIY